MGNGNEKDADMRTLLLICLLLTVIGCEREMKDDVHYDLEMKEEPSAWVHIPFQTSDESETFLHILRVFTLAHSIPESRLQVTSYYTNVQFKSVPMYLNSNIIISSLCVLVPEDSYGQSRMSVLRRDFAPEDFKRLADDYLARFRQAFSNRVQSTFEDNRK
jgi:hypothetical protein